MRKEAQPFDQSCSTINNVDVWVGSDVVMNRAVSGILKTAVLAYALYFIWGAFMAPHAAHTHQYEQADHWYEVFSASCQQQGSRSFWLEGYPMALCARCLGTYTGFFLFGLYWLLKPAFCSRRLFLILLVPGLGEKIPEFLGWPGSNEFRFVAGLWLGGSILVGLALIGQWVDRVWRNDDFKKISGVRP